MLQRGMGIFGPTRLTRTGQMVQRRWSVWLSVWLWALLPGLPSPLLAAAPAAVPAVETPLSFNNQIARINGYAEPNQKLEYSFYGTVDKAIAIRISAEGNRAQFEVRGRNTGAVYKTMNSAPWSGTLPETQDYVVAVTAGQRGVAFTLTVVLDAERLLSAGNTQVVNSSAGPEKEARYWLAGSAGQTLRVLLSSTLGTADFALIGTADGNTYKASNDSQRDWSAALPVTQDYLLVVSSPSGSTQFRLEVTLNTPQAERISFPAGGGTQVRSDGIAPSTPRQYFFNAPASYSVRLLLSSNPPNQVNFQLLGLTDSVLYKDLSNSLREFQFTSPISQDYLITLVAVAPANYTLELLLAPLTPIATPSAVPTTPPTPTPTPLPVGCVTDGILNGSFEESAYWILGPAPVPPSYVGTPKYDGLRAVRLGLDPGAIPALPNQKTYSSIRQPFQISPMAGSASLSWWRFDRSEEGTLETLPSGVAVDRQEVILLNLDNSTAGILYRKRLNGSAWQQSTVDLTGFIGRPLVLYFNTFNDDNGLRTWQYLDKVVLTVCYPPTPTPLPTSPPTDTPVPTATPMPTATPLPSATPMPTLTAAVTLTPSLTAAAGEQPSGDPEVERVGDANPQASLRSSTDEPTSLTPLEQLLNRPFRDLLSFVGILVGGIALSILLAWLLRPKRS